MFRIGNARRNNALTDLLAGDIASKVSSSVLKSLTGRPKRKKTVKRKRHNPHLALIGSNPKRKRRKPMAKARRRRNSLKNRARDSKGRLLKVRN